MYGILIPQRHGTQFRIIIKKSDSIITMYASVNSTYSFEVKNEETSISNQFSVKYTYVEEGDYLIQKFSVYHHIDNNKVLLPNVRVRMITMNDNNSLGMDIQFKEKIDNLGRLLLQLNKSHEIANISGWKSSMSSLKEKPEYLGTANLMSPTLSEIKQMVKKQNHEFQQLSKENIDMLSAQMDCMIAEEPLYVETLYTVPQPVHFSNIAEMIQNTIYDLALALAPGFVLDYLSVKRPEVDEKYKEIIENSEVKEFLSRFMKMYMNDNWANDKNLKYSNYVREVENYENKIVYYWNGDGETSMCLDPGYLKLIDVVEVTTYFLGILEIEPFLKDCEKWNKELYKYINLPQISAEICVEVEQKQLSNSCHIDYIFKRLSHENITTIDKQNCYCNSADKENALNYNADTAYRHLLLNRQLNDSLLFLESKDYQIDVERMYKVSEFISGKVQTKKNINIDYDKVKEAIDNFLQILNNEPMSNCGICLYKVLKQIDNPLIKKTVFISVIAMWNDSFTNIYQYENLTNELNKDAYQSIFDGIEDIILQKQDLYNKIFYDDITQNDIFASMEHISTLFFYTQAINQNHTQIEILHYLNNQRHTDKGAIHAVPILDIILLFTDGISLALDLSVFSIDNLAWEEAIKAMQGISTVAAGFGIMLVAGDLAYLAVMEATLSWIPVAGAVLAVLGVFSTLVMEILSSVSPSKMEIYAKEDCVNFLKNLNDPSQEWLDDFNERIKKLLQGISHKNLLNFS